MILSLVNKIFYDPKYGQFMRFALIGGSCFILEFALIYLQVQFLGQYPIKLWSLPIISSVEVYNVFSFAIALTINYLISRVWVFERGRYSASKEFMAFAVVGVIAGILSIFFFRIGLGFLQFDWLPAKHQWVPAKMFAVALVLIWNFIMKKFFVFKG